MIYDVTHHACEQHSPQMRCCHWTGVFSCRHLGFLTPLSVCFPWPSLMVFAKWAVLKCRGRSQGFSVYVCNKGQSHEKECVNYYSLNSRLKEQALTRWKTWNILWKDVAESCLRGGFSMEEISNTTLSVNTTLKLSLRLLREPCHFVWSVAFTAMTVKNRASMEAKPFSLILHELLFTDISFVWVRVWRRFFKTKKI